MTKPDQEQEVIELAFRLMEADISEEPDAVSAIQQHMFTTLRHYDPERYKKHKDEGKRRLRNRERLVEGGGL